MLDTPQKSATVVSQNWLQACRRTPLSKVKFERKWKRLLWGKYSSTSTQHNTSIFAKWVKPCGLLPETFQLILTRSKNLTETLRLPVTPEPFSFSFLSPTLSRPSSSDTWSHHSFCGTHRHATLSGRRLAWDWVLLFNSRQALNSKSCSLGYLYCRYA